MDELGIVGITAHGEKAAAYMADGYARVRKGPGICLCQNIGSTNLAAGLRDAYMAGSPVIAITGGTEPMSRGRGFYQEIEDFPTFEPLTKFNAYVEHVKRLPDLLRQAFRVATTGAPGPVHLQLQGALGSVLNESLDLDEAAQSFMAEPRFSQVPPFRPRPDLESVRKALEVIERAERPVIVAGGGVRWSGAGAQLAAFAEKAGIPVATSMTGKGVIDETSHLAVGVAGNYSRKSANQAVMRADLVLFIYREEYYLKNKEPKEGTPEHLVWMGEMEKVHGRAEVILGKQRHGPTGTKPVPPGSYGPQSGLAM